MRTADAKQEHQNSGWYGNLRQHKCNNHGHQVSGPTRETVWPPSQLGQHATCTERWDGTTRTTARYQIWDPQTTWWRPTLTGTTTRVGAANCYATEYSTPANVKPNCWVYRLETLSIFHFQCSCGTHSFSTYLVRFTTTTSNALNECLIGFTADHRFATEHNGRKIKGKPVSVVSPDDYDYLCANPRIQSHVTLMLFRTHFLQQRR